jgi:hypothetical protein
MIDVIKKTLLGAVAICIFIVLGMALFKFEIIPLILLVFTAAVGSYATGMIIFDIYDWYQEEKEWKRIHEGS